MTVSKEVEFDGNEIFRNGMGMNKELRQGSDESGRDIWRELQFDRTMSTEDRAYILWLIDRNAVCERARAGSWMHIVSVRFVG